MKNDIYLTEQSLKELLEGKKIYNDNDILHPPKTRELNIMIKDLQKQIEKRTFFKEVELDDIDLEEIARLVSEGYSSGKLNNGEGKNIYWELNVNSWLDKIC